MNPDNVRKKAQRTKSRQSWLARFHKQADKMKHASAVAETKASSLIRSIKNHSKILKLLQFEKFSSKILIFEVFEKGKARNTLYFC